VDGVAKGVDCNTTDLGILVVEDVEDGFHLNGNIANNSGKSHCADAIASGFRILMSEGQF